MSALLEQAAGAMRELFPTAPWTVRLSYGGRSQTFGSGPERIDLDFKAPGPLRELRRMNLAAFLDRYVLGEVDFNGDIYAFVGLRNHIRDPREWRVGFWRRLWLYGTHVFPSAMRRKLVAVSSHYDLPNEFILSYLDQRTRAYSCALWQEPLSFSDSEALEDAQHYKFHMAASELQVQPEDRFLDIGCGYGYQVHLVETEFGCKNALGITLSKNQVDVGYSRNLKLMHYMELEPRGQFDKIFTCGMISHLDRSEIERYYRRMYGLLRSGGKAWAHAIVPPANSWGLTNYTTLSGTFSQKYVFPDHFQFPIHVHLKIMEKTGFRIEKIYFRYGHYAKTLRHWYKRYVENLPKTRHLITPTIERAWHLYLTYGSILDGEQSVIKQVLMRKP